MSLRPAAEKQRPIAAFHRQSVPENQCSFDSFLFGWMGSEPTLARSIWRLDNAFHAQLGSRIK
jgi:hypothetical protein